MTQDPFLVQAVGPDLAQQWQSAEYKNKVANDPNTPKIKAALATGMKNLKALQDAGVRIAFGTDYGTLSLNGETVPVPVDSGTLKKIADDTGGSFSEAASAKQLQQVYKDLGAFF